MKLRRAVIIIGSVAALTVVAALVAARHKIEARYVVWRLDQAETYEEAEPWVKSLVELSREPGCARFIVEHIGSRNSRPTFWVFYHVDGAREFDNEKEALRYLAPFSRLVREFERHAARDEKYVETLARYVLWSGRWDYLNKPSKDPPSLGGIFGKAVLAVAFGTTFDDPSVYWSPALIEKEPKGVEVFLRIRNVVHLAEAWLLGMSPLPEHEPSPFPRSENAEEIRRFLGEDFKKPLIAGEMKDWIRTKRTSLRFDPAPGRFVLERGSDGELRVVPRSNRKPRTPREPFPGWEGPVPTRYDLRRTGN